MTCTLHDVVEHENGAGVFPYRCSRCGRCFLCGHRQIGYTFWICFDGFKKPSRFDAGVPQVTR